MQIQSADGLVRLTENEVIMDFGAAALSEKKEVSPRVIPYRHVLEIDYAAPGFLKAGHLRIVMREGQSKVKPSLDTYTAQLTGAKESNAFVEKLRQHVGRVEYVIPPASTEAPQVDREVTSEERSFLVLRNLPFVFKNYTVVGGELKKGSMKWPVGECEASVEVGAAVSARVTAARVAAGAVMFGSTGAVVGAIAKKDRSKIYLAITVPGDVFLEEVSGLDEKKARQFVTRLNKDAAAHREHPIGQAIVTAAAPPPPPPSAIPAGWYPQGDIQRYWDGSAWTDHTAPLPPS